MDSQSHYIPLALSAHIYTSFPPRDNCKIINNDDDEASGFHSEASLTFLKETSNVFLIKTTFYIWEENLPKSNVSTAALLTFGA